MLEILTLSKHKQRIKLNDSKPGSRVRLFNSVVETYRDQESNFEKSSLVDLTNNWA